MYWRLSDGLCLQTVEVAEITAGSKEMLHDLYVLKIVVLVRKADEEAAYLRWLSSHVRVDFQSQD